MTKFIKVFDTWSKSVFIRGRKRLEIWFQKPLYVEIMFFLKETGNRRYPGEECREICDTDREYLVFRFVIGFRTQIGEDVFMFEKFKKTENNDK